MTHHHHTLADHFRLKHMRKLGKFGIILLSLHLLFHIVELLLVPSIIAILTGRIHENIQLHDPEYIIPAQVQFQEASWAYLRRPISLENKETLHHPILLVFGK